MIATFAASALLLAQAAGATPLAATAPLPAEAQALADYAASLSTAPASEVARLAAAEAGLPLRALAAAPSPPTPLLPALERLAGAPVGGVDVSGLDPETAAAVGALVDAVARASALRAEAFADLSLDEQAFLVAGAPLSAGSPVLVDGETGATSEPLAADAARWAALAARVELAPLAEAQALLLATIESVLPVLQAPKAMPPSLSFPPYLFVDNTPATTWTADSWVMIDLQGDDTYRNRAGAASSTAMPVSILVDVAGNDAYTPAANLGGTMVLQGAGAGGVGVLYDAGGANRYSASNVLTPAPLTNPAPGAGLVAQGAATTGAGALVDLGRATFTATAGTLGGDATLVAQGAATLGLGLLVHGASSPGDALSARATSGALLVAQSGGSSTFSIGRATVTAQGAAGTGGAGVLAGGAGADSRAAEARGGLTTVLAQGGALAGVGALADAGGADSYSARSLGDVKLSLNIAVVCPSGFICHRTVTVTVNVGSSDLVAQGAARTGAGVLADAGREANAFTAVSSSRSVAEAVVTFAGGGGLAGDYTATATANSQAATSLAHGAGATAGAGVLVAGLGADARLLTVSSDARAFANATGGRSNTMTATAGAGPATASGQGLAQGIGVGASLDAGGADSYVARATSAAGQYRNGDFVSGTVGATAANAHAKSSGIGVAALLDLGGDADAYSVTPGSTNAGNSKCWSNTPSSTDADVGIGMDFPAGGPACVGLPPV